MKEKDLKGEIERLKKEASEQLEESAQDEMIRYWIERGKKLKKITIIYHGWELVYIEDSTESVVPSA